MKKFILPFILSFIICLPLCLIICFTAGIGLQYTISNDNSGDYINNINEQERYFRKINEIIKDLEFHSAKAKDGKIILYNSKYEPISEIHFAEYDKNIKFIGAHKKDSIVYFITGGAVDDEWGIMFVNDGSDSMMEGVGSVAQIRGNSYEYDTICKYYQ